MVKISFIIPFKYKWNSYSTVRSALETLENLGFEVDLCIKEFDPSFDPDMVWLMGSGTKLTKKEYDNIDVPVIAFGLSDPNLYQEDHLINSDLYCTNSLKVYLREDGIDKYWYPTCCDRKYHKNLNLEKTTDVLTFGIGRHPFFKERNEIVNKLRSEGIKVRVFGNEWDEHEDTKPYIEGEKLITEINKSKILLDLIDRKTSLPHRIFEGCGCGTPVLTNERNDTKVLFRSNEILFYNNFNEIGNIIKKYLNNSIGLNKIGLRAKERCNYEHNITHRIGGLLYFIKKRFNI